MPEFQLPKSGVILAGLKIKGGPRRSTQPVLSKKSKIFTKNLRNRLIACWFATNNATRCISGHCRPTRRAILTLIALQAGDIPAEAGHPPVADNLKKMVLHAELPILGGHVLMATDAPKEMGFTLTKGNMHICLEPAKRADTKRLFGELSKSGEVTMPLQDMFFGSYFGSCTDRFGINWMFSCSEKK
jgi:uncharacterized glyoxalase superfamily protein PhnB